MTTKLRNRCINHIVLCRRKEINAAIVGLKIMQNAEQSGVFCMIFRADLKKIAVFILARLLTVIKKAALENYQHSRVFICWAISKKFNL
jgi:hypothetical protein